MIVRLMKGAQGQLIDRVQHVADLTVMPDSPAAAAKNDAGELMHRVGITLELTREDKTGRRSITIVHLPNDGDAVFVMDDEGTTVQTYRWPIGPRVATMRTTTKAAPVEDPHGLMEGGRR